MHANECVRTTLHTDKSILVIRRVPNCQPAARQPGASQQWGGANSLELAACVNVESTHSSRHAIETGEAAVMCREGSDYIRARNWIDGCHKCFPATSSCAKQYTQ